MKLRITAGQFKGRYIETPKGDQTRPTSERLRQTVFDILGPSIEEAHFLDVFAGSGAMAIEAYSRGASHITLVEHNKLALNAIKKNLETLAIENATLLPYDAIQAIRRLKNIDIAFFDPPYPKSAKEFDYLSLLLQSLHKHNVINKKGQIFFEMPLNIDQFDFAPYAVVKSRVAGSTQLIELADPSYM